MSDNIFDPISFEMPKNKLNAIKVIGVGGGGSNAVNYMYQEEITGVDFVICNTDAQALENSPIPTRIQIGSDLTEGMGAGANPEIGEKAAQESYDNIKEALSHGTKMVFITAGMGGGTGTGAAPVIAKAAKEMALLTVGIVTIPFEFEGKSRIEQAKKGIEKLREHVDSLIIINNNKLREVYGNLGYKSGFAKADEVLATAAKAMAEVITHHYKHNIDLNDAKTVLSKSGTAIMGSAIAQGEDRAVKAVTKALDSPLLNDNKITGAKDVLLLIVSGTYEVTIDEIGEINDHIRREAGYDVNIILGMGDDDNLGEAIAVTIIATGFSTGQQNKINNTEDKKIIHTLEDNQEIEIDFEEFRERSKKSSTPFDADEKDMITDKIIHVLEEDVEDNEGVHDFDYIPTTDELKNIDVLYDEVNVTSYTENDFIVHSVEEKTEESYEARNQLTFTFDFPEDQELPVKIENEVLKSLDIEGMTDISEIVEEEQTLFTLEDESETTISASKSKKAGNNASQNEDIFLFEIKTQDEPKAEQAKAVKSKPTVNDDPEALSPLNMSIEQFKKTTEMRKKSMRQHNYTFRHEISNNVDEYEKEPAYKRMNVELSEHQDASQSNQSRTSISGKKDDIKLRTNNSFLHDNVD